MFKPWLAFDPLFFSRVHFDKSFHLYNPILFAGILWGKPLAMGFAMFMPFSALLDTRGIALGDSK